MNETTALAALLKPLMWPILVFVFLLAARWLAIVALRLLPDSRIKSVLLDRGLLERRPWIQPLLVGCLVAGIVAYLAVNF